MNNVQKEFFNKVIKEGLISMAIDGTLPSDMNELNYTDFDELATEYNNANQVGEWG